MSRALITDAMVRAAWERWMNDEGCEHCQPTEVELSEMRAALEAALAAAPERDRGLFDFRKGDQQVVGPT